ncbi:MAG: 30S ribosomal protein S12 methylthiotransferase RimO, partial [Planctomycetota bacterium]
MSSNVLRKPTVRFVSLGCPKNLVDSEVMLGSLANAGYRVSQDNEPNQAESDIFMVNTCCFIDEAEQESRDIISQAINIRETLRRKHPGQDGYKIVVSGCMAQRYAQRLNKDFKGQIDGIIGLSERDKVAGLCDGLLNNGDRAVLRGARVATSERCHIDDQRLRITPRHFAYLRIAEGCDNRCSYCVIPALHGAYRSKPVDKALVEAETLVAQAAREINLIAQDISSYGKDIGSSLAELLRELAAIKGLKWLRLLYTHPAHFTDELIDAIRDIDKVVKYVDLPIQHISDRMLSAMKRHVTSGQIRDLICKIRERIPGVFIRTSVIVGFPGETESDFQELMDFIRDMKFERLGAFEYSREKDTPAYKMAHQVPARVKKARLDKVMSLQQGIAFRQNQALKGRSMEVIIDSAGKKGIYIGRTYGDAPEVDGNIIVKTRAKLSAGDIVNTRVTGNKNYDLI